MSEHALAELLRTRRRALGWSQRDLAREAGLSHSYVGALERGRRRPTYAVAVRLARALALPPEPLLRAAGYLLPEGERALSPGEEELLVWFRALDPRVQDALRRVIRELRGLRT